MSDIESTSVRRPAVVTGAGYLMIGVAVLSIALSVLSVAYVGKVEDATRHAYAASPKVDAVVTATTVATYGGLVLDIIGAIIFTVFAVFNLRGSKVTRIATWVLAGVGVLCCGIGLVGNSASGMTSGTVDGVDTKAAAKEIAAAYPSWFSGVHAGLTVVGVLVLILVIILLALPAAHPYFRQQSGQQFIDDPLPSLPYPSVGGTPAGTAPGSLAGGTATGTPAPGGAGAPATDPGTGGGLATGGAAGQPPAQRDE